MKILNKADMYTLYLSGAFGNKLRTWTTYEDVFTSGYSGSVSLRYKGEAPGRWGSYRVPVDGILDKVEKMVQEGAKRHLITANESAPDDLLLIQGEVMLSERHYELLYSTTPGMRMNEIREHPSYAHGAKAMYLLKSNLCSNSYEDLQLLFDKYSECVIEFSTYAIDLGARPHRNTVFWEVRAY